MEASPTQDQAGVVLASLAQLDVTTLSVERMDDLYPALLGIARNIENTSIYLLREALGEAEADGSLYSQGAMYAAQAIDASYPEFHTSIEAALDEQMERLNEQSRTPGGTPCPF
jgi:hypothetical protein